MRTAVDPAFGAERWELDPAFPKPDKGTTLMHLLVWDGACSGGIPTTGRMSPVAVTFAPDTVTITIGVRSILLPPGGVVGCPMPPGTPATVELPEPVGQREIIDGSVDPSGDPSPDPRFAIRARD